MESLIEQELTKGVTPSEKKQQKQNKNKKQTMNNQSNQAITSKYRGLLEIKYNLYI